MALLAACGDDPPPATGGGTEASTGAMTSTGAPVPTTSSAATDDATGTASGTATTTAPTSEPGPTTGTTTSPSDPATTAPATDATTTAVSDSDTDTSTDTTASTADTTTADTSTTSSSTDTADTTDTTATTDVGSSSTGGCQTPADCPPPPPVECAVATCEAGVCGGGPAPMGTPCSLGVCDAQGQCVECLQGSDCPGGQTCVADVCVPIPANCMDNQKNGSETDIDCGGACPPCPDGDACIVDADCASMNCDNNVCGAPIPLCAQQPADPATGQRCPLFMPCTDSSECGVLQGCQQWFCNNSKTCELNALVGCWQDGGGACNADVVFTQQTLPPVTKRFVPPDGVNFREVASLVFTVKNNTASDLYLDKLPLVLDLMGNGSKFDVSSVKIFDNSGGSEHGPGDILVCLTANPFSFPANGTMGPCGGSSFSRVPKGQTNQFLVNLAFAADKTFINGRSYRLRLTSTAGIQFKVGLNGPLFAGSMCGVPNEGYTGAWVTAQTPP